MEPHKLCILTRILQHSSIDEPEALASIHSGPIDRHQILHTQIILIQFKVGIGTKIGTLAPSILGQIDVVQGGRDSLLAPRSRDKETSSEVSHTLGHIVVLNERSITGATGIGRAEACGT